MNTVKLNFVEKYIRPYMKSIMAFVIPFAGNLLAAGQEDSHAGSVITGHEWLESFLLAVVSASVVWRVTNTSRAETIEAKRAAAGEGEYAPEHAASGDDT